MGGDKRLSRGERSGRYGSDGHREHDHRNRRSRDEERDYDHRWSDERQRDHYDDHSPERGRKRQHSNDSDDEYDFDFPDQDDRMEPEEENKTIMFRGLALHTTEDDIALALRQLPGPQPVEIRLMKKRGGGGISRGFAFVEFYHLQDSTRWMETNQNKLVIHGKSITVHYGNKERQSYKPRTENWLCNACGLYNFRKREKCFRCGAAQVGDLDQWNNGDTIILRNIAPLSSVDSILSLLAPFVKLSARHIRLIKDKQTGQNRGFAFVQLSSPLEASQLLNVLQGLQPPLKLDGKTIGVDYARSARKDSALADGIRANALSVASTAIAAAQWSSSQLKQAAAAANSGFITTPEAYAQQTYQLPEGSATAGDGLLGAAPGLMPPGVVLSQSAQVYQPVVMPQSSVQQVVNSADAALTASLPVSSNPGVMANASVNLDTSSYQYDESSGYYYDPQTGLYYDPNSQYFYNSETQQYLYWDNEKQTYVPAPGSETNAEETSTTNNSNTNATSSKEPKEKKEKPKSKSAQQIAKDMERWAKTLNRQKENKNSSGVNREEERKESASADAGFYLFEKKQLGVIDMPSSVSEPPRNQEPEPEKGGLVAPYMGDSDPEETFTDEEAKITDWSKMVCLLCRRQFPTKEGLLRHQQLSDLHKQNLEIQRRTRMSETELEELERRESELKYRDRAAERREKYGVPEPPAPKKKFKKHPPATSVSYEQPTKDGLTSDNIGNKMLQAMGWQEGKGLGRHQQGITTPIAASLRTKGTGLGVKGAAYELSASDTYKDAVRKAMFARYTELE